MLKMYVKAKNRLHALKSYMQDTKGATAIEYGLIVGGVAVVILAAVFSVGTELSGLFESVAAVFESTERCVEVDSSCKK